LVDHHLTPSTPSKNARMRFSLTMNVWCPIFDAVSE
jgi:hypothetical protein